MYERQKCLRKHKNVHSSLIYLEIVSYPNIKQQNERINWGILIKWITLQKWKNRLIATCNSKMNFAGIMLNRRNQTLISTFNIDVKCENRQNQAWVTEVRIVLTFGEVIKTWEVYEGGLWGTGNILQCLDLCGSYGCKNLSDTEFVRMCVLDYMWFVKNQIRKDYVVLSFSSLEVKVKVSRDRVQLPCLTPFKSPPNESCTIFSKLPETTLPVKLCHAMNWKTHPDFRHVKRGEGRGEKILQSMKW